MTDNFVEFQKLSDEWEKDGRIRGGNIRNVSRVLKKILLAARTADKMGYDMVAEILSALMIAINNGSEDLSCMHEAIFGCYNDEGENECDCPNCVPGNLNLFDENGKRLTIGQLLREPTQLSLGI